MGTFTVPIRIGDLGGTRFEEVEALADTGATTTVIPRKILNGLGIRPTRQETFEYANGQQTRLDMAQATAQAEGRETITWIIFGEEGMSLLLEAYTLEGLFLAVDPYNQRLAPVNGVLKQAALRAEPGAPRQNCNARPGPPSERRPQRACSSARLTQKPGHSKYALVMRYCRHHPPSFPLSPVIPAKAGIHRPLRCESLYSAETRGFPPSRE